MKKVVLIVVALCVIAAGGYGALRGYRHWKPRHLVSQAKAYLAKRDAANAALCLQKAYRSDPSNVEACRMLAGLMELARNPLAIGLRQRVVEIEPANPDNRFALIQTALTLNDLTTANQALLAVDAKDKNTADYHKLLAALAFAWRQFPVAESNYVDAIRLEPNNPVTQYDLACVQLVDTNQAQVNQGRATLEALRKDPKVARMAARQLTLDALSHNSMPRALQFSAELLTMTNSGFPDRIMRLTVLDAAKKSNELSGYLASVQKEAATNNVAAFSLAKWMCESGRTREALAWVGTLPPAAQTTVPMPVLTAEAMASLSQWTNVLAKTKAEDWNGMEYLRHAYRARASQQLGDPATQSVEWHAAIKEAGRNFDALEDLGRRTVAWNWDKEMDETLWAIVDRFPTDEPAIQLLHKRLYAAGNTPALQSLLSKASAVIKEDALENNLAIITLLRNPQDEKAHDMARAVYEKDPKNPYFVSTYAYSLYLKQKSADALKLFASLPPDTLTNADVAIYYGVILAGSGHAAQAQPYLKLGGTINLLPEEKELVAGAQRGIRGG